MSRREETLVKWDKDKKWEELYCNFLVFLFVGKRLSLNMSIPILKLNHNLEFVTSYPKMEVANKAFFLKLLLSLLPSSLQVLSPSLLFLALLPGIRFVLEVGISFFTTT